MHDPIEYLTAGVMPVRCPFTGQFCAHHDEIDEAVSWERTFDPTELYVQALDEELPETKEIKREREFAAWEASKAELWDELWREQFNGPSIEDWIEERYGHLWREYDDSMRMPTQSSRKTCNTLKQLGWEARKYKCDRAKGGRGPRGYEIGQHYTVQYRQIRLLRRYRREGQEDALRDAFGRHRWETWEDDEPSLDIETRLDIEHDEVVLTPEAEWDAQTNYWTGDPTGLDDVDDEPQEFYRWQLEQSWEMLLCWPEEEISIFDHYPYPLQDDVEDDEKEFDDYPHPLDDEDDLHLDFYVIAQSGGPKGRLAGMISARRNRLLNY